MIIINKNFNQVSTSQSATNFGIDLSTLRKKYVYQLIGSTNCGGTVRIEFPNGLIKKIRTKNLFTRLDNIFYQLMAPNRTKIVDTWIRKLKAERQSPFTYDEIKELKIWVQRDDGNF